jgi:hypothetical protein
MLALEFIIWWYTSGWVELARRAEKYIIGVYDYFSVALLSKTILAPWKQIVSYGSQSINERMRATVDNLVSRMVGLTVRLFVLVFALFLMLGGMVFGAIALFLWPLLPLIVPILVVRMVLL